MCGIAGILRLDGAPVEAAALHRMETLLRHRGPDGRGFAALAADPALPPAVWRDPAQAPAVCGPFAMAHRRLAILDRSETGHQPMAAPDGRLWIVFNGEVYNHPELRRELASSGAVFRGPGDTETVLAAWARWGEKAVERLEGMFAFALWDRRERCLHLVRDRFGIKPLYYARAGTSFAFASEIKPVLAGLDLAPKPRAVAAMDLLRHGRKDHRAETFFEGVLQLLPAHHMTVTAVPASPRRYYALPPSGSGSAGAFREALEAAIASHLRSEVATGTCLSGGLDSSSITGLVARLQGRARDFESLGATPSADGRFHTFSARHRDPRLDEGPWIEAVGARHGVPNHAVRPDAGGFFDALPALLWHQEEPFPSGSVFAQWQVMERAAEAGVKVLLDGQGADEILAGYPGTNLDAAADALRHGALGRAVRLLSGYDAGLPAPLAWGGVIALALRPGRSLPGNPFRRLPPVLLPALLRPADPPLPLPLMSRRFDTARAALLAFHLPALLHYEDRNSMAHGLEARVPFLDRRLVEAALALPEEALFRDGFTKQALREAASDVLPASVRERRDKTGFPTPDRDWLAEAAGTRLRPMLDAFVQDPSPWIDWRRIRDDLPAFLRTSAYPGLMPLLILELWRRQVAAPDYLTPREGRV